MIKLNDTVVVPAPSQGDNWAHSFFGRVVMVKLNSVIVENSFNAVFEVETYRVVKL